MWAWMWFGSATCNSRSVHAAHCKPVLPRLQSVLRQRPRTLSPTHTHMAMLSDGNIAVEPGFCTSADVQGFSYGEVGTNSSRRRCLGLHDRAVHEHATASNLQLADICIRRCLDCVSCHHVSVYFDWMACALHRHCDQLSLSANHTKKVWTHSTYHVRRGKHGKPLWSEQDDGSVKPHKREDHDLRTNANSSMPRAHELATTRYHSDKRWSVSTVSRSRAFPTHWTGRAIGKVSRTRGSSPWLRPSLWNRSVAPHLNTTGNAAPRQPITKLNMRAPTTAMNIAARPGAQPAQQQAALSDCVWATARVAGTAITFDMCTYPVKFDKWISRRVMHHGCFECDQVSFIVGALSRYRRTPIRLNIVEAVSPRRISAGERLAVCGPPHEQPLLIDVGANIGMYALSAAAACFQAIAFEPVPMNAAKIMTSARANHMSGWLRLYTMGVGDTFTTFEMGESQDNQGEATHCDESTAANASGSGCNRGGVAHIPAGPLDALLPAIAPQRPVFVKMDVEGGEVRTGPAAPVSVLASSRSGDLWIMPLDHALLAATCSLHAVNPRPRMDPRVRSAARFAACRTSSGARTLSAS